MLVYDIEMEKKLKLQENLNALIGSGGITLTVAARKAKMNKSTLHNYMNGVVPRGLKSLVMLSEVLRVSPSVLLFGNVLDEKNELSLNSFKEGRFEIIVKPLEIKGRNDELP